MERDLVKTRPGLIFHISGDNKMSNHKGQMSWNLHVYFASNCCKSKKINVQNCRFSSSHFFFACFINEFEKNQRGARAGWKIYTSPGWFLEDWEGGWDEIEICLLMVGIPWLDLSSDPERYIFTDMHERLVFMVMWIDIPYVDLMRIKTYVDPMKIKTYMDPMGRSRLRQHSWPDCIFYQTREHGS